MNTNSVEKALYDPYRDNRQDVFHFNEDKKLMQQADAVACFVHSTDIKGPVENRYQISNDVPTLATFVGFQMGAPYGANERFREHKTLARATGFLITSNRLLTAAHVVCENGKLSEKKIKNWLVVFGYKMKNDSLCTDDFRAEDVYKIKKVVDYACEKKPSFFGGMSYWTDWAVVKLDRKVTERVPLSLHFSEVQDPLELYMFGYPSGTPLKLTSNATITDFSHPDYLKCRVDAFGGNSGSPLVSEKGVVGILCEGEKDYEIKDGIVVSYRIQENEGFEKCQRISRLTFLQDYIACIECDFKLLKWNYPLQNNPFYGLHIQIACNKEACTLINEKLWKPLHYGIFHMEEIDCSTLCTSCKKPVQLLEIGLYQCQYTIKGHLAQPKKSLIKKTSTQKTDKIMKVFGPSVLYAWNYLEITTKPF